MNWQPIETAPKDGTRILLFVGGSMIVVGQWDSDRNAAKPKPYWDNDLRYVFGKTHARSVPITHWMPLPKPPSKGAGGWREGEGK